MHYRYTQDSFPVKFFSILQNCKLHCHIYFMPSQNCIKREQNLICSLIPYNKSKTYLQFDHFLWKFQLQLYIQCFFHLPITIDWVSAIYYFYLFTLKLIFLIYETPSLGINPLDAELNPICHLLALLGTHHMFHVNSI